MKAHTKIYFESLGYAFIEDQYIPSELSYQKAADIHHITDRSNRIENLMALTRSEHDFYGDKQKHMVYLLKKHRDFLLERKVKFNNEWFAQIIARYEDT